MQSSIGGGGCRLGPIELRACSGPDMGLAGALEITLHQTIGRSAPGVRSRGMGVQPCFCCAREPDGLIQQEMGIPLLLHSGFSMMGTAPWTAAPLPRCSGEAVVKDSWLEGGSPAGSRG